MGALVSDRNETHQGGCYCGTIRYEITERPLWSGHCHCRSCQKALGGAFVTWAKVASSDFRVIEGTIKTCSISDGVERGFCGDCGTTLTYGASVEVDGQDWREDAWFAAATLDDPSICGTSTHT